MQWYVAIFRASLLAGSLSPRAGLLAMRVSSIHTCSELNSAEHELSCGAIGALDGVHQYVVHRPILATTGELATREVPASLSSTLD